MYIYIYVISAPNPPQTRMDGYWNMVGKWGFPRNFFSGKFPPKTPLAAKMRGASRMIFGFFHRKKKTRHQVFGKRNGQVIYTTLSPNKTRFSIKIRIHDDLAVMFLLFCGMCNWRCYWLKGLLKCFDNWWLMMTKGLSMRTNRWLMMPTRWWTKWQMDDCQKDWWWQRLSGNHSKSINKSTNPQIPTRITYDLQAAAGKVKSPITFWFFGPNWTTFPFPGEVYNPIGYLPFGVIRPFIYRGPK